MQGFLLSIGMFGIMITTIPTGYFAGILGGKKIVGLAMLISSVLNLLVPLAADYGLPYVCLIRIIQGLSQGMSSGALPAFWPKWAPPLERTQLIIIGLAGTTMGSFISVLVGGFLCEYPGWPSIFYIFGGFGCVYSIAWFFLAYDDPLNHPLISNNEKEYIISSMVEQVNSSHWSLPFKAIIKALPFWAIIIPAVCRFWLVSNLTTSLPTLLDNMFDINIKTNGFLSALPLITSWITMTLGSHTADFLLSKKVLTLIRVRKLFTFLGMLPSSLFILVIPYVETIIAIIFLILAQSLSGLCYSGFIINPLDIAPRSATSAAAMSDSRHEATRARGQNAEEGFFSLPSPPQFVERQLEDAADALLCPERLPAHPTQKRKGHGSDYEDAASSDHSDGQHLGSRDPRASRRDPRASRSHGDRRDAVSSVGRGEWQERRMSSAGCRPHRMHKRHRRHRMRRHSWQLVADQREPGGQREREASCEGRDQRAFFPVCEFEDGEAAAGSGPAGSSGAEVLSQGAGLAPPSSPCSVQEPSQDVEDAPRRPELAADCQRCHRRPCRWAAWEEQERDPSCSSYPHLGRYEWSWGRPGSASPRQFAAGCQMCHGRPCHWAVRVELELWPSRSSYPDLGPWEWNWGRRGSTSRCPEHRPTCHCAHRF